MSESSDLLNGLLPFPVSFTTLALILLAGTYTGYRLTELRRFEPLVREAD